MLAAEHTVQPGAELCPVCRRFPLDMDAPLDLSQWDYVDTDFKDAVESNVLEAPPLMVSMPEEGVDSSEDLVPKDVYDEEEEPVRTCYHCYQAESELAELCPVCSDSYLPPALRQPHRA
jgi:hypothetical protein